MQVYILRGLPGCGKSTWINSKANLTRYHTICSADHYHIGSDGIYKYDPAKAGEAYNLCLRKFTDCVISGGPDVTPGGPDLLYVDNTNTTIAEIAPYYRVAEAYGGSPVIVHIPVDFSIACQRNIHKVPPEKIWAMYQNLLTEKLPSHWKVMVINHE